MQVNLYSGFSKRINSTKLPNTTATVKNGTLRNPCSVTSPEIEFKTMGQTCPANFCYAYIPSFQRYYFITDWVAEGALWVCRMNEDCLASWKTAIGNTSAYIDRCASDYNGDIIDTTYITGTNFINHHVNMSNEYYEYNLSNGCFILGIIDSNSATDSQVGGAVCYYVLTPAQCRSLMAYLLSDNFLSANGFPTVQTVAQDMSQEMAKAFIRPIEFITSCTWYPFPVSAFTNASNIGIKVGYWEISTTIATGKLLQASVLRTITYGELPEHPQAQTRGNYLNYAPYTRIMLEVPPFGNIPIDTSFRSLGKYIYCGVFIDPITGIAIMQAHCSSVIPTTEQGIQSILDSPIVYETSGQFGVPIQLAQVNGDYVNFASETVQAVSSIDLLGGSIGLMMGGPLGAIKGAINKDVVSHAANAITSLAPQVRGTGTNGSRLLTKIRPMISIQWMPLVDEDNTELGRPLREIRTINTLSGYIKCFEVTVDFPCYDMEKETIHEMLKGGFFYE